MFQPNSRLSRSAGTTKIFGHVSDALKLIFVMPGPKYADCMMLSSCFELDTYWPPSPPRTIRCVGRCPENADAPM